MSALTGHRSDVHYTCPQLQILIEFEFEFEFELLFEVTL